MDFLRKALLALVPAAMLVLAPAAVPAAVAAPANWLKTVRATSAGGYLVGNPAAPVKVIEYFSLTCGHCRHFAEEGLPSLKADYVAKGKVSLELRNFVLNPYDMAASLLMRCAVPARAVALYEAVYAEQEAVFAGARNIDKAASDRIMAAPLDQRAAMLAREAGIARWFAGKGVAADKADRCLLDKSAQQRLADERDAGAKQYEIKGTPGFVVNGKTVDGNSWEALERAIKAAL